MGGLEVYLYFFCKRAAYLYLNGFRTAEVGSKNRYFSEGIAISQLSFSKFKKELLTEFGRLDVVKKEDGVWYILEVKRSSRTIRPALMQLKYYLWKMLQLGFRGVGILAIPREKKRIYIKLTKKDVALLKKAEEDLDRMRKGEFIPRRKPRKFCRNCAFFRVCWA